MDIIDFLRQNKVIGPAPKNKVTSILHKIPSDIKDVIIKETSFCEVDYAIKQRIWFILYGITSQPKCKHCSENVITFDPAVKLPRPYCSISCAYRDTNASRQKTCMERYGHRHHLSNKNIYQKQLDTNMKKYGVSNISQLEETKQKANKTKEKIFDWWWNYDKDRLLEEMALCENNVVLLSKKYKVAFTTIYKACLKHNIPYHNPKSRYEIIIGQLLTELGIEYICNRKNIIAPLELDIYIPSHNVAIEINGIYWHSEKSGTDRYYHLNKTKLCEQQNIKLIHIFDVEIDKQFDIVKSRIKAILGLNERVYARKCSIREIDNKESSTFLEQNHIQGSIHSSVRYGAFYNNELIAVMTFGKSRFNKNYEYELIRFCSKTNVNVIGIASKLLKRFKKEYNPSSIISYSDKRWSSGNLYKELGFNHLNDSLPNYWYHDYNNIYHRVKFQKHKLASILDNFDSSKTEWENMLENGYDRFWDCGNGVWVLK